jgi:hypothetical protein
MSATTPDTRKECDGLASPEVEVDEGRDGPDSAWATLRKLNDAETKFVLAALRGESYEAAAEGAGWKEPLTLIRVLARPHVKESIQRLAPLLPDAKRAAQLLAPYLMADAVDAMRDNPSAQSSGHARRDLLALAGFTATSRTEHLHASMADVLAAIEGRKALTDRKRTDVALPALPAASEARLGSGAYVDAEVIDAGDRESVASPKRRK